MAKSKAATAKFKAAMCRQSYHEFFREFWPTIAAERLRDAWYIRKLCDVLQEASERVFNDQDKEGDIVWNCPPGTSKPIWEGHSVMMGNGTWKKLRDVQKGDLVIGKSGNPCRVKEIHVQGMLRCIRITTAGGRQLTLAPDHVVMTADGWREASTIVPGQMLALMHRSRPIPTSDKTVDDFALAGYLIGDGSLTQNSCSLTNTDPDYLEDFCSCVSRLGFDFSIATKKSLISNVDLVRIALKKRKGQTYGPRDWVRNVGLSEKNSYTKFVPDFVWKGTDEQVAAFLAAFFHCDGHVSCKDSGKRNIVVSMTTVSKKLAVGLHRLCLRLGISMRLRKHVNKNGFKYNRELVGYVTYRVETSDQDAAVRFMERIPLRGRKKAKLEGFLPKRKTFEQEYWPDKVVSVESMGENPCRCLTVEGDSSFVVEGVVVHNSSIVSILWQPWIWTRMPSARIISGSYSERLALDHSRKSRDVIMSEKYQALFPNITLRDDQNTKSYFVNSYGGMRYAVGVGGSVIGMHAHFIIIDDPIDPQGVLSDLILAEANHWMTETLSRRKVRLTLTPTILIMQRLHQDDPTGHALESRKNIIHYRLPSDIEIDDPPEMHPLPAQFRDFYIDGLLDPVRLPQVSLDEALTELKEVGYAGQYKQNPVPRGGAMFKVDLLRTSSTPPTRWKAGPVRYWDKAGTTKKKSAFTVGVLSALDHTDTVWILDVNRFQAHSGQREAIILSTAKTDGPKTTVVVEQEPASSGIESAEATIKRLSLAGIRAIADKVSGDKELRADVFSQHVNTSNVILVNAGWNKDFVAELRFFPRSKFKDQVDAASGSVAHLVKKRIRIGAF